MHMLHGLNKRLYRTVSIHATPHVGSPKATLDCSACILVHACGCKQEQLHPSTNAHLLDFLVLRQEHLVVEQLA